MLHGEQQIFNLIFWNAIHYIIWIQKGKELEDYYLFIHATGAVVLPVTTFVSYAGMLLSARKCEGGK